ncbi:MAG: DUF3472 domain-containing protein [Phycisphaerales bacterium]|jgi:hypothetical protein|nr:DUF3472 domain-containing protein [Phycisphaerales bacterium]MBT7171618.1 DUF3472 domain-containing protein [Phycisphaerales bacterium]
MRLISALTLTILLVLVANLSAEKTAAPAKPKAPAAEPPSRRADSIHIAYPQIKEMGKRPPVVGFYNEIQIKQTCSGTFFMAAGFQHGYFGVQDLRNDKRVVIFSCWDGKGDPIDPRKVKPDRRTRVIYKGKDVRAGRFGGEGTGAQSFYSYSWKVGETLKFYLQATPLPKENATRYTGWFYLAKEKAWKKIATFQRPGSANTLHGHHSFLEDFTGHAADKHPREMLCGPAWLQHAGGEWFHIPFAKTSQSPRNHRYPLLKNTDFGIAGNLFRMTTGALTKQIIGPGQWLKLPKAKIAPKAPEIKLPKEPDINVPENQQAANIRTRP